ncbi:MAG: hypothetical protein AB9917_16800 [Negativicutes bacterium]
MKISAPKKIVCSALIGLLQFGGGSYMVEAASNEALRRHQQETRGSRQSHNQRLHERFHSDWLQREQQEQALAHWRKQEHLRHEQALRRNENENEREWRHRQWLEEQRLQHLQEEMRRRQWWEHQRHEEEMRRFEHESSWAWRQRQLLETRRHEQELRQIEIALLAQ